MDPLLLFIPLLLIVFYVPIISIGRRTAYRTGLAGQGRIRGALVYVGSLALLALMLTAMFQGKFEGHEVVVLILTSVPAFLFGLAGVWIFAPATSDRSAPPSRGERTKAISVGVVRAGCTFLAVIFVVPYAVAFLYGLLGLTGFALAVLAWGVMVAVRDCRRVHYGPQSWRC